MYFMAYLHSVLVNYTEHVRHVSALMTANCLLPSRNHSEREGKLVRSLKTKVRCEGLKVEATRTCRQIRAFFVKTDSTSFFFYRYQRKLRQLCTWPNHFDRLNTWYM